MYTYTIVITCKREHLKELTDDLEAQFLSHGHARVLGSEVSFQSRTGCTLVEWRYALGITFLNQLNLDERVVDYSVFSVSDTEMQEDTALIALYGPYPRIQEQGE
jgi:hypothetical protein